jgi:hypothetical protein
LAAALSEFSYQRKIEVDRATQATITHADSWMSWALLANAQRRAGATKEAAASEMRAVELARRNPAVSYGKTRKSMH